MWAKWRQDSGECGKNIKEHNAKKKEHNATLKNWKSQCIALEGSSTVLLF